MEQNNISMLVFSFLRYLCFLSSLIFYAADWLEVEARKKREADLVEKIL